MSSHSNVSNVQDAGAKNADYGKGEVATREMKVGSGGKVKPGSTREKRSKTATSKEEKDDAPQPSGPPSACPGFDALQFTRDCDKAIGTGSYKKVYKAFNNDTAKSVAWNVIQIETLSPADKKRAVEEIKLLSKVGKHKHIMAYHCLPCDSTTRRAPHPSLEDPEATARAGRGARLRRLVGSSGGQAARGSQSLSSSCSALSDALPHESDPQARGLTRRPTP